MICKGKDTGEAGDLFSREKPLFPKVWITIHDVMPCTMEGVTELVEMVQASTCCKPTLLVVPGSGWKPEEISQLKRWSDEGCALAGHGWKHQCESWGGLYHRLHGMVFSRRVAEHLERDERRIKNLLVRNYDWFGEHKLPSPKLYVAPAWAMGSISRDQLRTLSFRYYEYFNGIFDARNNQFIKLPLIGYEADSLLRKGALKAFNRNNIRKARRSKLPLRLSIHPRDHRLKLAGDLNRHLKRTSGCINELDLNG